MPEHSIEELERQLKSDEDKAKDAALRVSEARKRLFEAKFEATGFSGCVAEFGERRSTARFLPKKMSRWGLYIVGPAFKKDGTLGIREVSCQPSHARNLGPYEAAS